jgi:hypothetical protein
MQHHKPETQAAEHPTHQRPARNSATYTVKRHRSRPERSPDLKKCCSPEDDEQEKAAAQNPSSLSLSSLPTTHPFQIERIERGRQCGSRLLALAGSAPLRLRELRRRRGEEMSYAQKKRNERSHWGVWLCPCSGPTTQRNGFTWPRLRYGYSASQVICVYRL